MLAVKDRDTAVYRNSDRLKRYISGIKGLIAYWPMDDDGSLCRNIAPKNRGQLNGTVSGPTPYRHGAVGRGYYFDGVNDRIVIASDSRLQGMANITIGFLMRSDNTTVYRKVFHKGGVYDFGINDLGEMFIELVGVQNFGTIGVDPIVDDDKWRFIAVTYDGSTAIVYNNVAVETATGLSGSIATSTDTMYFGNNGGTEWHLGMLQHVFMANRALTATEIGNIAKISGVV